MPWTNIVHDLIEIFEHCFTEVAYNHVELGTVYFLWLEQIQEGWDDLEAFLSLQGILNHQAYSSPPKCFPLALRLQSV